MWPVQLRRRSKHYLYAAGDIYAIGFGEAQHGEPLRGIPGGAHERLERRCIPDSHQSGQWSPNILLFSVGAFPEITEEESRPGSLPHQNDSIERAQTIPSTALTLNGALEGPERDVFRLHVNAGERRVFEVEARRCGSAIDPVIRVLDGSGKVIARSEDDPMLSLDARVAATFPKEGFYYIEVHDARFSTQSQNFYRLKTGSYDTLLSYSHWVAGAARRSMSNSRARQSRRT